MHLSVPQQRKPATAEGISDIYNEGQNVQVCFQPLCSKSENVVDILSMKWIITAGNSSQNRQKSWPHVIEQKKTQRSVLTQAEDNDPSFQCQVPKAWHRTLQPTLGLLVDHELKKAQFNGTSLLAFGIWHVKVLKRDKKHQVKPWVLKNLLSKAEEVQLQLVTRSL